MYLRPASCAAATAACNGSLSRAEASLISIGRLMPAMTSTLPVSITEMARFDGVPPNMSVSRMTPSPPSTARDRVQDVLAALLHVVVGADAHGAHGLLLADHVLGRRDELLGQPTVGDQYQSDHGPMCAVALMVRGADPLRSQVAVLQADPPSALA